MNDDDLGFLPATELVPMIRGKKISPVEVVGTILKRIERLEPKLNAMTYIGAERAMDAARARRDCADARPTRSGPLHGVTVTIKDLAWTKDFPDRFRLQSGEGFPRADRRRRW